MSKLPFLAVLALMIACAVVVSLGKPDPEISLDSARQLWSDVLRDADDLGLQLTRVSADQEMQLGDRLAAEVGRWGKEDPDATRYVAAVGAGLVPGVNRKAIRYHFHVLQSPGLNAFALPGGQIYVLSGMLDFLRSESELAAVLGHEMSHVDLRHCIEQYQYQLALKKAGAGDASAIAGLAHALVAIGYRQDQELEADLAGQRLAVEAGYDPDAAVGVFQRMQMKFHENTSQPAATPGGELSQAIGDALGSYFRTHPPS
ncbi:MAG TPA: M48 family metalloprotease, partial [Bryobacteraceae bacterium]|nr:M48 family metalloprotease [Bryobacteraceae bacterium]